jgi:hypothetical protein
VQIHSPVIFGPDAEGLLDGEKRRCRVDHVEDGHVGAGFCEALCKSETTASGTSSYQRRSAFERELSPLC